MSDGSAWTYPLTDALSSVRGYADTNSAVLSNVNYTPVGVPDTNIDGPAFTGEWRTGGTGIQYHSARYYSPNLGIFPSLDPFEGITDRPMSLNGYSWVEGNVVNDAVGELIFHNRYSYANGNPVNFVDPSGMIGELPSQWQTCNTQDWFEEPEECCGPVIDDWFMRTVNAYMTYNGTDMSPAAVSTFEAGWLVFQVADIIQLLFTPDGTPDRDNPIYRYATYGLVVRTANIDYRAMATTPPGIPTPCYTDVSPGNQLLTLCGLCINASDLGNFLFGATGNSWGFSFDFVVNGAQVFNAATGDFRNIIRGGPDIQGVMAGYEFASRGTENNVVNFCDRMRNTGRLWHHERTTDPRFQNNIQVACGLGNLPTATLNSAPTPITRWDRYIFDPPIVQADVWPAENPEEELRTKWRR